MFAVIRTGGKQYRVAKDDVITVEKLAGEAGDKIDLTDVLMVGGEGEAKIGAPLVDGASVKAEIVEQGRARKVLVFKKKRRHNYRRTAGHRQHETVLKITDIAAG
jgi:large subunit ribosomal protein L21